MTDYHIYEHDSEGTSFLKFIVGALLVIFFPIGIIVLIVRTINKVKDSRSNRKLTAQQTRETMAYAEDTIASAIENFKRLEQKGIITHAEFEAKKQNLLYGKKMTKSLVNRITAIENS